MKELAIFLLAFSLLTVAHSALPNKREAKCHFLKHPNFHLFDDDMIFLTVSSESDCHKRCEDATEPDCLGFNFQATTGYCTLSSRGPEDEETSLVPNPGTDYFERRCFEAKATCRGFTCADGYCINPMYRCDGKDDCGDASDEQDCDVERMQGDQAYGGGQRLESGNPRKFGANRNGNNQRVGSNPINKDQRVGAGNPGSTRNNNNQRTNLRTNQNSNAGNAGNSKQGMNQNQNPNAANNNNNNQRVNPNPNPNPNTDKAPFRCADAPPSAPLLPASYVCDGMADCEDGSDEASCSPPGLGCSGQFRCSNRYCVPIRQVRGGISIWCRLFVYDDFLDLFG
jgi:hypothetical protein